MSSRVPAGAGEMPSAHDAPCTNAHARRCSARSGSPSMVRRTARPARRRSTTSVSWSNCTGRSTVESPPTSALGVGGGAAAGALAEITRTADGGCARSSGVAELRRSRSLIAAPFERTHPPDHPPDTPRDRTGSAAPVSTPGSRRGAPVGRAPRSRGTGRCGRPVAVRANGATVGAAAPNLAPRLLRGGGGGRAGSADVVPPNVFAASTAGSPTSLVVIGLPLFNGTNFPSLTISA